MKVNGDNHERNTPLLRLMKKISRSAAVEKLLAKRDIKRRRSSSSLSSDEKIGKTKNESNISSYAPLKSYSIISSQLISSHSTGLKARYK